MVRTKESVVESAKKFIAEADKFFSIKKGVLFGSYAYGKPHIYSDIDVAIVSKDFEYFPENLALKQLFRLARHLDTSIAPVVLTEEEYNTAPLGSVAVDVAKKGLILFER
jgi:predicted nucleotidyltransferase